MPSQDQIGLAVVAARCDADRYLMASLDWIAAYAEGPAATALCGFGLGVARAGAAKQIQQGFDRQAPTSSRSFPLSRPFVISGSRSRDP